MRMKMSAIFATVVALAFVASVVAAPKNQARTAGLAGAQRAPIKTLAKALNLTPQQVDQVKAILTSYHADLKALKTSGKTRAEKIAAAKQLRDKAKADIYALLNVDQKAKADQTRVIDRLLNRGMAEKRLLRCLASLNLTQNQKTQISGFTKDAKVKARAVRQDTNLAKDAKQAQLKQIRQALLDQISSVLTAEQKTQFAQCSQERAGAAGKGLRAGAAGRK